MAPYEDFACLLFFFFPIICSSREVTFQNGQLLSVHTTPLSLCALENLSNKTSLYSFFNPSPLHGPNLPAVKRRKPGNINVVSVKKTPKRRFFFIFLSIHTIYTVYTIFVSFLRKEMFCSSTISSFEGFSFLNLSLLFLQLLHLYA